MRFSWLLCVVVSVFSILVCLANAQDGTGSYLYHICSGANYTSNSIYQTNLNTLLSSVSSNNDIDYGFYNISEGEGIERVNSIALCRGDLSLTACRRCVNFSTTDLPQRCPNQKEAIVWYDNCMFRYSNKSIFYSMEGLAVSMWNQNNVSNVSTFTETLDGLLSDLRENASAGDSRQKFAIGDTEDFTTIYGLVQCTPDLTALQCSNCLENSFRPFVKNYPGRVGGRVLGPNCNFRYEIYQFYDTPSPPTSPPPPPPPAISPSPRTTTIVPPTGGGSNRNIVISVVSAVCFVILIVC